MSGTEQRHETDVIVVGGGNAGFTAAHAAAKNGRQVLLLEKGASHDAGGNSFYTAGATRITHHGLEDLRDFIEPDARHAMTTVPPYTSEDYAADLDRVTEGRNDKELTAVLIDEVTETLRWLHALGLKYRLMYERQSYQNPDGTYLFWGGLHVGNVDGGQGLMADHTRVAGELGVEIQYGVRGKELLTENGKVIGVKAEVAGREINYLAESVILTAGGFEADPEMRSQHLGQRWSHAKVRGTPHNTGDMLNAALAVGAERGGDWSSCHSVQWDAFTPHNESNRELTNRLTRQSYPLGILVNKYGNRFLDEGADFRNYTYAKYGKCILEQPDALAFQIFDAKTRPMLRAEEYEMPGISEVTAETVGELAEHLGIEPTQLQKTVSDFNSRINVDADFDPNIKDGRRADVEPPKSNWAETIDVPPFYAYPVTCGITFTFGGLKTDTHGRVLDRHGQHIRGLYAAGEMLGGLFANNYPGGSGLAAGCVFGRRAGQIA